MKNNIIKAAKKALSAFNKTNENLNKFRLDEMLNEATSEAQLSSLKVGDTFSIIDPAVLSARARYYKLSPKKYGDAKFKILKINKKTIDTEAVPWNSYDKLPQSAFHLTDKFSPYDKVIQRGAVLFRFHLGVDPKVKVK